MNNIKVGDELDYRPDLRDVCVQTFKVGAVDTNFFYIETADKNEVDMSRPYSKETLKFDAQYPQVSIQLNTQDYVFNCIIMRHKRLTYITRFRGFSRLKDDTIEKIHELIIKDVAEDTKNLLSK